MISNKLHNSIQELTQLSALARTIVHRFDGLGAEALGTAVAAESTPEVNELREQVAALKRMVEDLGTLIEDAVPSPELTDVQASDFNDRFTKSLGNTHPSVLARVYHTRYFKSIPRNVRLLMATVLVNHASKTPGFETPDVWNTLIANSGHL